LAITSYQSDHKSNKQSKKQKCIKGVPEPTMQSNEIEN